MVRKIIIDTDIGDDIDDALAIALAIKSGQFDIAGITTVFKNTNSRARIAKRLLELAGRPDVPIYAGYGDGLKIKRNTDKCIQYEDFLNDPRYAPINDNEGCAGESAIDFIIDSAERYGKELTVVAIGPLSNIARAIEKNPNAMRKLDRIVIMGGAFFLGRHEWNIFCDPEAAKTVFESGIPLYCVGLDVTQRTRLNYKRHSQILDLRGTEGLKGYLATLAGFWSEKRRADITLHDPLTVFALYKPDLLYFKEQRVYVETEGRFGRGLTINLSLQKNYFPEGSGYPVFVAHDVDEERAMSLFMKEIFDLS